MKNQEAAAHVPAGLRYFVQGSVFLLGTAVLVLEILGARVISPYYGSSVYAWSAQITVTLASLAAGYWFGGVLADRRPQAAFYFQQILAAGALVVVIPFLTDPILSGTTPLGLMGGSLASATLLFAPSLLVLSATGPLAIRLVTADVRSLGRGVGSVYAVSTAGSVTGALLTGFVLVPRFPLSRTLFFTGAALMALGGLGLWRSGRRGGGASAVLAAALTAAVLLPARDAVATNVLVHRSSLYGDVKVMDLSPTERYLLLNGVFHGMIDLTTGESQADYIGYMEFLPLFRPGAGKALVIGLGVGSLPEMYRRHHALPSDTVEIDPVVAELAQSHFGYVPTGRVAVEDGRTFLERSEGKYGVIVLDAFASESIPYHLFTEEFFRLAKSRMAPGGVLGVNVVGNAAHPAWHSVYKTLARVYAHVRVFPTSADPEHLGNLVLVASDVPVVFPPAASLRPALRPVMEAMLKEEAPPPSPDALERAPAFTDDFNPIDEVYRPLIVRWRKDIIDRAKGVLLYGE